MTNKRNQYTREFKLEAISLVTDHNRTMPDVASSLTPVVNPLDLSVGDFNQ